MATAAARASFSLVDQSENRDPVFPIKQKEIASPKRVIDFFEETILRRRLLPWLGLRVVVS